jgi:hypothetical protein
MSLIATFQPVEKHRPKGDGFNHPDKDTNWAPATRLNPAQDSLNIGEETSMDKLDLAEAIYHDADG